MGSTELWYRVSNSLFRYATILAVDTGYSVLNMLPHEPLINVPTTKLIGFFIRSTGIREQEQSRRMNKAITKTYRSHLKKGMRVMENGLFTIRGFEVMEPIRKTATNRKIIKIS